MRDGPGRGESPPHPSSLIPHPSPRRRAKAAEEQTRFAAVRDLICRHPHWTDRGLARFAGVHRNTVRKLRCELEHMKRIPAVDHVMRSDGSLYPYRNRGVG